MDQFSNSGQPASSQDLMRKAINDLIDEATLADISVGNAIKKLERERNRKPLFEQSGPPAVVVQDSSSLDPVPVTFRDNAIICNPGDVIQLPNGDTLVCGAGDDTHPPPGNGDDVIYPDKPTGPGGGGIDTGTVPGGGGGCGSERVYALCHQECDLPNGISIESYQATIFDPSIHNAADCQCFDSYGEALAAVDAIFQQGGWTYGGAPTVVYRECQGEKPTDDKCCPPVVIPPCPSLPEATCEKPSYVDDQPWIACEEEKTLEEPSESSTIAFPKACHEPDSRPCIFWTG